MKLLQKTKILLIAASLCLGAFSFAAPLAGAVNPSDGGSSNSTSSGTPAPTAKNSARCYNQLSAIVYWCSGGSFQAGKCYIYNDRSQKEGVGWQEADCSISQFQNIPEGTLQAVPATSDPAVGSCKGSNALNHQCGLIEKYVNPFIAFLSALVGVAVAIGIIVGGIQYSTSAGDPQKAAKAKDHITRAVMALVAFAFLWAFLEWLVPGGFLNG